jgi:hypothetical protein
VIPRCPRERRHRCIRGVHGAGSCPRAVVHGDYDDVGSRLIRERLTHKFVNHTRRRPRGRLRRRGAQAERQQRKRGESACRRLPSHVATSFSSVGRWRPHIARHSWSHASFMPSSINSKVSVACVHREVEWPRIGKPLSPPDHRPWKWSRSSEASKDFAETRGFSGASLHGWNELVAKAQSLSRGQPRAKSGTHDAEPKKRAARSRRSFMRNGSLPYLRSSSFRTRTSGRPSRCGPILPPISFMCAVLPCASKEA